MMPAYQYLVESIYSLIDVLNRPSTNASIINVAQWISWCRPMRTWSGKAACVACRLTPSPFRIDIGVTVIV